MLNILASPGRYIQGKGALGFLGDHGKKLGSKFFILISESGKKRSSSVIDKGMTEANCTAVYDIFNGECSKNEIQRVREAYKNSGCDVIIGIGGGKVHDTAKAAAHYENAPVIIVPTIASTDAPCSALSVIYSDEGVFEEYFFLPTSPNLVLVDTDIISKAPARLLIAGMGDALATYFEARACMNSDAGNFVGGKSTLAAMSLAKLCYDTLLNDGYNAKIAVENKICIKAVERIVEANTLLSGLGFESVGLAACHAIHNGLTVLSETHNMYHGEKVAFGVIVQLILENDTEALDEVLEFCFSVGLPMTLEDLGAKDASSEKIMEVAKLACSENDTMGNMPFEVTPEDVYAAIIAADAMGRDYK